MRVDPQPTETFDSASLGLVPDKLSDRAQEAADLLKALAHTGRLMILCHLVTGPKSVGDLAERTQLPQATTSQLLTRLRHEGMVNTRREGKLIYYSLSDPRAANVIACVYETFCG